MKLVVGLGNPGPQYQDTPHNLGFQVIDNFVVAYASEAKPRAEFNCSVFSLEDNLLAKPQTFMNLSGPAVKRLAAEYGITPEQTLVIYDDVDLPLGSLRSRKSGGSSGHKGVESVISAIGPDFYRLRLGILKGNPADLSQYVLEPLSGSSQKSLEPIVSKAVELVRQFLAGDMELLSYRDK